MMVLGIKFIDDIIMFTDTQLVEAIVLPMTHKERFENLGIAPPKGTKCVFSML